MTDLDELERLDRGQPPFDVPLVLREALAAMPPVSRYSSGVGIEQYRQAASAKIARVNRVDAPWQQVFYSQGATQGLAAALAAICEPGDVVAVPSPGYPNYSLLPGMLGLKVVYFPAVPNDTRQWVGQIATVLSRHRPRAVVLNYPSNPLGTTPSADQLEEMYDLLAAERVYVIADECYDELSTSSDRSAMAEHLRDRLVMLFSMSKSHAIPSWRMGYMAVPEVLAESVARYQEYTLGCGNAELQAAASEALLHSHGHTAAFNEFYERVAAAVRSAADRFESLRLISAVGMYSWLALPMDSPGTIERIARETRVKLAPGRSYGPGITGYARVAHIRSPAEVTAALARVDAFLADL